MTPEVEGEDIEARLLKERRDVDERALLLSQIVTGDDEGSVVPSREDPPGDLDPVGGLEADLLHGSERRLTALIRKGALIQVTGDSVTGAFGPDCARSAALMLKKGWVHFLASDAHWVDERAPVLSEARDAAARLIGEEAARVLVEDNPRAALEGEDIDPGL